jgi:hypothetical protein
MTGTSKTSFSVAISQAKGCLSLTYGQQLFQYSYTLKMNATVSFERYHLNIYMIYLWLFFSMFTLLLLLLVVVVVVVVVAAAAAASYDPWTSLHSEYKYACDCRTSNTQLCATYIGCCKLTSSELLFTVFYCFPDNKPDHAAKSLDSFLSTHVANSFVTFHRLQTNNYVNE